MDKLINTKTNTEDNVAHILLVYSIYMRKCSCRSFKLKAPHLRLPTDVYVVSSICYASFDHWFTIKSVLRGEERRKRKTSDQKQAAWLQFLIQFHYLCYISSKSWLDYISSTYWTHTVENNYSLLAHDGQWFLNGYICNNDINVCPQLRHGWLKRGKKKKTIQWFIKLTNQHVIQIRT